MKTYSKFWIYGRNSCDATVTTLLSYGTMRLVLVFYKALTIFLEWFLIRYSLELPVSLYNLPNRHLIFCSLLLVFLLYYTELMNWFSVSSSRDLFWLCLAIHLYTITRNWGTKWQRRRLRKKDLNVLGRCLKRSLILSVSHSVLWTNLNNFSFIQ